ncbi:OVARIAN TUMOR DOMAIN-containing deubiquitinating enzyme 12-like isoform X4 [Carex rostrata]
MYERDQHVFWGYDLFHGPFPNTSYYGDLNQPQNDFNYTDVLYSNEGNDGDAGPSSSSSSPDQNSGAGEEWMDLSNYSEIDDEMEKRLYQMVPIRHVPRINGAIPSYDEATTDHERLTDRLQLYDVVERKVQGDGNCQFRALSDQFYRSPEHHQFVRQQIVSQLESHREMYEGYVPMPYNDYLEKLSESGQWGDHVTLQAAADTYGVKIFVLTSFKDTCYIEILPKVEKSKRVIFLSFWAEVHYNSIYPNGVCSMMQSYLCGKQRRRRNGGILVISNV